MEHIKTIVELNGSKAKKQSFEDFQKSFQAFLMDYIKTTSV